MASKKLTTDEVNALMEGLAQSSSQSTVDIAGSDEVRPFTFGEDDLSLMGDYFPLWQATSGSPVWRVRYSCQCCAFSIA